MVFRQLWRGAHRRLRGRGPQSDGLRSALRHAVRTGDVTELAVRWRNGEWDSSEDSSTLQQAALAGTLIKFLELFPMPLQRHPRIASMYFGLAEQALNTSSESCRESHEPTAAANLIANFVKVPHIATQRILHDQLQHYVFFKDDRSELHPAPSDLKAFPGAMCVLFLQRMVEWRLGEKGNVTFDEAAHKLTVRTKTGEVLSFETSVVYNLNLFGGAIPPPSTFFVYIYPHGPQHHFHLGGFLFIDKHRNPLQVTRLSLRRDDSIYAMSFGPGQDVTRQTTEALDQRLDRVTSPLLERAGASIFCFVGPHENVHGEIHGGRGGGFVFLTRNQSTKFFPIEASAEIVERSCVSWHVTATLLAGLPSNHSVVERVVRPGSDSGFASLMGRPEEISCARLRSSGLNHPVVLRALSITPNTKVLETLAVKAVVNAVFRQVRPLIINDIVWEVLALLSMLWTTRAYRDHRPGGTPDLQEWHGSNWLAVGIFGIAWLKDTIIILVCLESHARHGWIKGYFHDPAHVLDLVHVLALTAMLVALFTVDDKGVLLAIVGSIRWLKIVLKIRCFHQLGLRILPILVALNEVAGFLMVTLCILAASFQSSFALTHFVPTYIWFGTTEMAVTNRQDTTIFIVSPESSPQWCMELALCIIFGFMVMGSLSNIFIRLVSKTFMETTVQAGPIFVRALASIELDMIFCWMFARRCKRLLLRSEEEHGHMYDDSYVWFCYPRHLSELPSCKEAQLKDIAEKLDVASRHVDRIALEVAHAHAEFDNAVGICTPSQQAHRAARQKTEYLV